MYLVTAATDFEMAPFNAALGRVDVHRLVTGVGPVETAVRLMAMLNRSAGEIRGVVNFGVAGAYVDSSGGAKAGLLDVCLAEREVLGDFGVCLEAEIERISGPGLDMPDSFVMDEGLLALARQALHDARVPFVSGCFVTVNCASGTAARGAMLEGRHDALCENMEGGAVARACREFGLPCLEVRCISNLVEDRDTNRWKLKQACRGAGEAASLIVRYLVEHAG